MIRCTFDNDIWENLENSDICISWLNAHKSGHLKPFDDDIWGNPVNIGILDVLKSNKGIMKQCRYISHHKNWKRS